MVYNFENCKLFSDFEHLILKSTNPVKTRLGPYRDLFRIFRDLARTRPGPTRTYPGPSARLGHEKMKRKEKKTNLSAHGKHKNDSLVG
jgi:hypothetical protein